MIFNKTTATTAQLRLTRHLPVLLVAAFLLVGITFGTASAETLTIWSFAHRNLKELFDSDLIPAFERQHPGTKVELVTLPYQGFREKLLSAFAAGAAPDMFYEGNNILPLYLSHDLLLPLDKYLEQSDLRNELINAEIANYGGKQFGIPATLRAAPVAYRASMLELGGFDSSKPPETWDDLLDMGRKLLRVENGKIVQRGVEHVVKGNLFRMFNIFLQQNEGRLLSPDLTQVTLNSDKGLEALEFLAKLQETVEPPVYQASASNSFAAGEVAVVHRDPNVVSHVLRAAPNWLDDVRIGLPLMQGRDHTKRVAFGGGNSVVISKTTPNPDISWKFIEFIYQDENVLKITNADLTPPAVRSILTSNEINPLIRLGAAAQFYLQDVRGSEAVPEYPTAAAEINDIFARVMSGETDPKNGLEQAAQIWRGHLQERLNSQQ